MAESEGSVSAPAPAPSYTCPRHKVETPLTCSNCGDPICPKCYVRTAVGLRCPKCAEGVTVKLKRQGPNWLVIGLASGAVVVALIVVALVAGGGGKSGSAAGPNGSTVTTAPNAASGYRLVSHAGLAYSIEVPFTWQPGADNTDTVTSYATARVTEASLRVTANDTDSTAAQVVDKLNNDLRNQGGQDFVVASVQVGGMSAIRLDYKSPSTAAPGAALSSHTTYVVKRNSTAFTVELATTDPGAYESVFAYIASSFKFL